MLIYFLPLILVITANGIDSEETFLLLTQSLVMTTLNLKLGSWLRINQMQKNMRDNTPAKVMVVNFSIIQIELLLIFSF